MKSSSLGIRNPGPFLVFAITALFFLLFFALPIGETLSGAFRHPTGAFTLAYVGEVFRNPIYVEGLWNSFLMATLSTALSLAISLPLAFLSDRYLFPGKALFSMLILVPMVLPPFVGAIGIKQILGQEGALNALLCALHLASPKHPLDWLGSNPLTGVVVMNALHLYPILYLNLVASLANIDPAMEEAAENLGCTGLRKFWRITLPLMMPGLFAGGTIVFIWAFTELGVPLMFDYQRVTSVQIFNGLQEIGGNPFPYALVAVMLVTTVGLYAISKALFGRTGYGMMPKATSQGGPRSIPPFGGWLCAAGFALVAFLAMLPHIGVILVAFSRDWYGTILPQGWTLDHFRAALGHDLTLPSIGNSLKYASLATLADILLGIAIAWVVTRSKIAGRQLLDAMAMLPLAVPGIVLAFGYLAMTQPGRLFGWMNPAIDPLFILVIAYSIRRLPYVVRSAAAGFQQTSVTLEEAAQNLGCPPLRILRKITIPLIAANLIAGGLLAFSFAMLEVSDSLILAQRQQDFPITKAIYELYQILGEGRFIACALGVWAMVFLAVTILGASIVLGRKLGAIFRV
ncbi:MAG TPA: iron ABC transporter permease [Chthoniobacterales bacterium]